MSVSASACVSVVCLPVSVSAFVCLCLSVSVCVCVCLCLYLSICTLFYNSSFLFLVENSQEDALNKQNSTQSQNTNVTLKHELAVYCNIELGDRLSSVRVCELLQYVGERDRIFFETEFKAS